MSTDVLANTLTALSNAQKVGKERVALPYSGFKERLVRFLQEKGIVASVRVQDGLPAKLIVSLLYKKGSRSLRGVRRLSAPGRRWYVAWDEIPYIARAEGFVVVSTSHGILDGEAARKKRLGGELLCEIRV
jgi:small subunit ribosomal protein S8